MSSLVYLYFLYLVVGAICDDECAFAGKCGPNGMCPNGFQCQPAKNYPLMHVCCESKSLLQIPQ